MGGRVGGRAQTPQCRHHHSPAAEVAAPHPDFSALALPTDPPQGRDKPLSTCSIPAHATACPDTPSPQDLNPPLDAGTFVGATLGSLDGQQVEDSPEPTGVAAEMGFTALAAHPGHIGGEHSGVGALEDRRTQRDGAGR